MRFPGHETLSIGNRVRVYAALNKVIITSILLSLFMITASKSYEKTVNTMSTLKRYLANAMRYGGQFKTGLTGVHD